MKVPEEYRRAYDEAKAHLAKKGAEDRAFLPQEIFEKFEKAGVWDAKYWNGWDPKDWDALQGSGPNNHLGISEVPALTHGASASAVASVSADGESKDEASVVEREKVLDGNATSDEKDEATESADAAKHPSTKKKRWAKKEPGTAKKG